MFKLLVIGLAVAVAVEECSAFTIGTKVTGEQKREKKQIFQSTTAATPIIPTTPGTISLGQVGNVHYSIDPESLKGLDPSKLGDLTLDFTNAGQQDENLKKLGGVRLGSLLNGNQLLAATAGPQVVNIGGRIGQEEKIAENLNVGPTVAPTPVAAVTPAPLNLGQNLNLGGQNLNLNSGLNLGNFNLGQSSLDLGQSNVDLSQFQLGNLGQSNFDLSQFNLGGSDFGQFNGGLNLGGIETLNLGSSGLNLASLNLGRNYDDAVVTNADASAPASGDVDKHVYFYGAPEEEELPAPRVILPPTPKKNVKVIFVKAPAFKHAAAPIIAPKALQHGEEKTVVYVLVKKPEAPQPIVVPTPPPTEPSKPEVVFIKYKNQKDAEEAVSHIQSTGSADGFKVGQVSSGNSIANGQEFLGQLGTKSNLNLDLLTQRAGQNFGQNFGTSFVSTTPSPLFGSSLFSTASPLTVTDTNLGLSGLNGFNSGFGSTTTLGPILSSDGLSGLSSLGDLSSGSLGSIGSTTLAPATVSTPGTLFDSFGGGDDSTAANNRISFKFVKSVPHSEYGPPKRSTSEGSGSKSARSLGFKFGDRIPKE